MAVAAGGYHSLALNTLFAHSTWYLAEGTTAWGFETWLSIQNPNGTQVEVTITYLRAGGGTPVSFTEKIAGNTRKSCDMSKKIPDGRASILVKSKSAGRPIMVERAMYWNNRGAGAGTIGGHAD